MLNMLKGFQHQSQKIAWIMMTGFQLPIASKNGVLYQNFNFCVNIFILMFQHLTYHFLFSL